MKGRMKHGEFHSPSGHHDIHHGGKHVDHSLGHTAREDGHHKGKGHHRHGSKVGGRKGKHHAGHYARGGSAKNPLSGADTHALPYEKDTIPKEDEGGKGKGR